MTTLNKISGQKLKSFRKIIGSTDFSKAVLLTIGLTLPIIIGVICDQLPIGVFMTMGVLLASPNDIGGNLRLKLKNISLAVLLSMIVTLITASLSNSYWIFLPVLALLVFGISYLAVFGFRASIVGFSGLFALVLNMAEIGPAETISAVNQALLIGLGGIWYLILIFLYHQFFHKGHTEELLSKTFRLTGDYLQTRADLIIPGCDRNILLEKLLQIQTQLSENHEELREILISHRRNSGKSDYQTRRLLIFAELVDMLELAMVNPVNYKKTDLIFEKESKKLKDFTQMMNEMSQRLYHISSGVSQPNRIQTENKIDFYLNELEKDLSAFTVESEDEINEEPVMLRNFFKYQKLQAGKLARIERLLKNADAKELNRIRKKDLRNFVKQPDYNLSLLTDNFNFKSAIFRHSLRMTAVTLVGYLIGAYFELQNFYWILMTIIVIMRPTYGLTKKRSKERTVGTIIGGLIAVGIVFLIQNTTVFAILAIVSLIVFFSMMQKNYKLAAVFITLNVVFVFALLEPDVYDVIQYRIYDTLIGAGLSVVANMFFWPTWEIRTIQNTLAEAFKRDRLYLREIAEYYNKVGEPTGNYKLARKEAFLAASDLSAAFQRMTQEPKSKQKYLEKIYGLAMLNHTFLVSAASLNTYTIYYPTTPATEKFNSIVDYICKNLSSAEEILNGKEIEHSSLLPRERIMDLTYGQDVRDLLNKEKSERQSADPEKIEELHLVYEQLNWLLEVSEKIVRTLTGGKEFWKN